MFINISDTPSTEWSMKKIIEAKFLDLDEKPRIVDIQLPNIGPKATTKELHKKVEDLMDKVYEKKGFSRYVVFHVMGDAGLMYNIVKILKFQGYPVCYSTTKNVITKTNKEKISTPEFVQFRHY